MIDTSCAEVRFAIDTVRDCAQLTQRVQTGMALMGLTKSDFSPVTVADYAVQAVVGKRLADAFGDDVLVAEESASLLRSDEGRKVLDVTTQFVGKVIDGASTEQVCDWVDLGTADPGSRFWVLDPVDGTKGYLRGGQYAVALALVEDGVVSLGVLGCPNLGEGCVPDACGPGALVVARRGDGSWFTPLAGEEQLSRLAVSETTESAEARVLRSLVAQHTDADKIDEVCAQMGVQAEPVLMDSMAKCAVLAAGAGDLLFRLLSPKQPDYREKIWDQAAGSIVIEEAGGRITDLEGKPLDFAAGRTLANNRGVVASNGPLHERALEALQAVGAIP